jgi:hypothetical protein
VARVGGKGDRKGNKVVIKDLGGGISSKISRQIEGTGKGYCLLCDWEGTGKRLGHNRHGGEKRNESKADVRRLKSLSTKSTSHHLEMVLSRCQAH